MGAIFVTKCSLTLQTDMLGTPEILWEHDRFDAQYEACRKYLEVGKRVRKPSFACIYAPRTHFTPILDK